MRPPSWPGLYGVFLVKRLFTGSVDAAAWCAGAEYRRRRGEVDAVRRRLVRGLITAEPARRLDGGQFVQIEIDDGLQRLAGGSLARGFGQGLEPGGVFRL